MAILFVFEVSRVSKRMNNIIFNSKKHQVVGQLVLDSSINILVHSAEMMVGLRRVERVGRRRGIDGGWLS